MTEMTLIDLLRHRASSRGTARAYTFLEDGDTEAQHLTYAGLDERARAVASALQAISRQGDRALLLYPAGLDFLDGFFGCLYAGVVGIPTPPPEASRLKRTGPRLQSIVDDARATVVVTTSKIRAMVESADSPLLEGRSIRWLATDEVDSGASIAWREPRLENDPLAYLQYTSGSTVAPKGVMIGHANLVFHARQLQKVCGYASDSVTVTWMPNFHDYGLVEGLIEPLYNGTPCYVMSPLAFVKRPVAWLRAITKYKGTHSQAPNFAYDHCVKRIGPALREGLDLQSWRAAGNAAEPINPRVIEAFAETFAPHGFRRSAARPAYGLAEATLLVSSTPLDEEPRIASLQASALEDHRVVDADADDTTSQIRLMVGCGRVFPAAQVAIVDPETKQRCQPDEVGEIWVSDRAVAQGYWERPEETEETFGARIEATGEGPFLRTGDLGFLKDGQLFIAGRLKDVIIIRGTNHHPQDIEWTVQAAHPSLRPENGAAFSAIVDGDEKLIVAQEVEREAVAGLDVEEVARSVRQAVAESHDLDLFALLLLTRSSVPKTASGKIRRQACQTFFHDGGPQVVAHWTAPSRNPTTLPGWMNVSIEVSTPTPPPEAPVSPPPGAASVEVSRTRADALIAWLRDYAATRINSRLMDERRCVPPHILLDFGNRGILGMQVPEAYGGLGLRHSDALRVLEQLAAIDLTLATLIFLNSTNGIRPIQYYARPALRDEILPRLATGRELASFALSEPGAGSNLGGLEGRATPNGKGGWTLRGVKRWNSAAWAGIVSVFVRLVDDRGRPGSLTGFAVRQGTPGLRIGPEALTTGLRASIQNSIFLEDVEVGPETILGELGRGMEVAEDALTIGRLCIGAVSLGGMKRCAQLLLRYGSRRSIASGRLLDNPAMLATLGELTAWITAIEAFKDQVATRLDMDATVPPEVPMALKVLGSDALIWAASQLMQLLGGRGYMENNIAPRMLRDARVLSVGEGPNEPLTTQIGRKARHTRALSDYLRADPDGVALADAIEAAMTDLLDRIQRAPAPWADATTAQLWADALIGQLTSEAMLLGATRALRRQSPSAAVGRTLAWAELRFARTLDRVRKGRPEDRLIPTATDLTRLVLSYDNTIGDVDQTLAGEEEELDAFLSRSHNDALSPGFAANPSQPAAAEVPPAEESKRETLARLLRQKLQTQQELSPNT